MSDKRSVATDALQTLGTIITDGGRDAIHLAVEPVVAGEKLYAGQDIGMFGGEAVASMNSIKKVGIVDPFLRRPVEPGEKFWLIVYPRQITSLRHVWSHPDFDELPKEVIKESSKRKEASEAWLKDFLKNNDGPGSYHGMLEAIESGTNSNGSDTFDGEYLHMGDLDGHCDIPPEFWDHIEIVTGIKVNNPPQHFTCSC